MSTRLVKLELGPTAPELIKQLLINRVNFDVGVIQRIQELADAANILFLKDILTERQFESIGKKLIQKVQSHIKEHNSPKQSL